jgi:hypothetical protein
MSLEQDYNQQCLDKLVWAINQLNLNVKQATLTKIAGLIVQTMTGPWRYFHTPDHIFEVGGSEDPIEVLAALFHDVVYYQVDRSINFNLSYYVTPFIQEIQDNRGTKLAIRDLNELPPQDFAFDLAATIFGFLPGQELSPFAGQNEFLSAIVCGKVLESFTPPDILLQILACIEATIPFRAPVDGLSPSDRLFQKLQEANRKFKLNLADTELTEAVKRSVRMANRDVGSFAYSNSALFLDNTWNLLPETNHNLKNAGSYNPGSYTVQEYRVALQKMEGFMGFLKPQIIFQQYKGEPDNATYQGLIQRAQRNLDVAELYLGSKLYTIALLEALSLRFGRATTLATIMGEVASNEYCGDKLEDFLPSIEHPFTTRNDTEREVMALLEKGRYRSSDYDLKNSPLTTFIVKYIGFDNLMAGLSHAQKYFKGEMNSEEFLAQCNPDVNAIITKAMLRLFDSRKAALSRV